MVTLMSDVSLRPMSVAGYTTQSLTVPIRYWRCRGSPGLTT
ncbi:hypothetical protein [Endozoicomonas sp. ONNA2]|nr:hypothetical protein [Endozoicomonas sp. ONNA2]